MSITGKIKTLFSDKNKTEALFPRTKVSAVSDDNGVGLNVLLEQTVPMSRGGTGAENGAEGLANLFAAGGTVLSPYQYGAELPTNAAVGQVYFEEATGTIADIGQDVAKALRAVNLLDNSDFRNPINQRGQTSYTGNVIGIDRWNAWSPNGKMFVGIEENCIRVWNGDTGGGSVGQKFPIGTFNTNKNYTFAYKTTDGIVYVKNNPIEIYNDYGYEAVNIGLNANQTLLLEWAALYEGEYTVESLPPYVPKGYSAELAECQRYCVVYGLYAQWSVSNITDSYVDSSIILPSSMRVQPSIQNANNLNVSGVGGWSPSVAVINGNNLRLRMSKSSHGITNSTNCFVEAAGQVIFSADL